MLDETCVAAILARYFPTAEQHDLADAAKDVVLMEMLADDRLVIWEDALRDRQDPALIRTFVPEAHWDS